MPAVKEPPARYEMRKTLRDLTLSVREYGVDEFDLQQLGSLNIRVEPMMLDEASSHKPLFFAPYPGDLIPDPDEEALEDSYKGIDEEGPDFPFTGPSDRAYGMNIYLTNYISHCEVESKGEDVPWSSKNGGDYPFTGLYKLQEPVFGCYHITDMPDPAYPHVKALIYNNMLASDSTILCGELLPILRIMLAQLRQRRYIHHWVAPVLIFSLMGFQPRVIEAYFLKDTLVLRPTKLYDFTHGNDAAFKTFAQWYMGKPVGDTIQAS